MRIGRTRGHALRVLAAMQELSSAVHAPCLPHGRTKDSAQHMWAPRALLVGAQRRQHAAYLKDVVGDGGSRLLCVCLRQCRGVGEQQLVAQVEGFAHAVCNACAGEGVQWKDKEEGGK